MMLGRAEKTKFSLPVIAFFQKTGISFQPSGTPSNPLGLPPISAAPKGDEIPAVKVKTKVNWTAGVLRYRSPLRRR